MYDFTDAPKIEVRDRNNGEAELEVALPYLKHITEHSMQGEAGYAQAFTESLTYEQRNTLLAALLSIHNSIELLIHGIGGIQVQEILSK